MRQSTSREHLLLNMRERLVSLFEYLRSHLSCTDDGLTEFFNGRLPRAKKLSKESVRRWASGTQSMGRLNRMKLAQALGCNPETLKDFLEGKISQEQLLEQINLKESIQEEETQAYDQLIELADKLSLPALGRAIAYLGELFAARWKTFEAQSKPGKKTIAQLVSENWSSCVEMWQEIFPLNRLRAIANGAKPTLEELELLEPALPALWEDLVTMQEEMNGNGNHQGCSNNH
ncbi:MAG: hypothetical protein F6K36_23030 [Symploca sp. SIO3C6]|nr:hypothetical protein [Symploca sp. SIO3C6]NET08388.1 hypothetical protein [Symploca sp. SIO2B6]NET47822.1 hypothetical protein [Merismopedia sp. SIO2A8]